MSKIGDKLNTKTRPLNIFIILLILFFIINISGCDLFDSQPQEDVHSPYPVMPQNKDEEPYIFDGYFAKDYKFKQLNKLLYLPSGNLLAVDRNSSKIVEFAPDETIVREWKPTAGLGRNLIYDIAVDRYSNTYVVFPELSEIRLYNDDGTLIKTLSEFEAEDVYSGIARLQATSVALDSENNLYTDVPKLGCILKYGTYGSLLNRWGTKGNGPGQFSLSSSNITGNRIAVDSLNNIYINDSLNHRIQKFDPEGNFIHEFGGKGGKDGQLFNPAGITVGPDENIYVVDNGNRRIQIFSPDGELLGKWGKWGEADDQFSLPYDITFDMEGRAYVADFRSIKVFRPYWMESRSTGSPIDTPESMALKSIRAKELVKSGMTLARLENYDQAIIELNEAIKLDPVYAEAYLQRGASYMHLEEFRKAAKDFDRAIKINPSSFEAHFQRGVVSSHLRDKSLAIRMFNKAIELDPGSALPFLHRGRLFLKGKYGRQALKDFGRAIELDPNLFEAYYERGLLHYSLKKYGHAIRDLDRAIEIDPENSLAFMARGRAHRDNGDTDEGLSDFIMAESLEKDGK